MGEGRSGDKFLGGVGVSSLSRAEREALIGSDTLECAGRPGIYCGTHHQPLSDGTKKTKGEHSQHQAAKTAELWRDGVEPF